MRLSNWSYSRYSTWKKCPALLRFQAEYPMPRVASPAMDRGTKAHKLFEDYILGKSDDLEGFEYYRSYLDVLRTAGAKPELPIALDKDWKQVAWDDENRWWRGVLDLQVLSVAEAIIVDWKTGQEYADHKDQRDVYALAYNAIDGSREWVRVIHTYIDKKQNTFSLHHVDSLPALRKKWEGKIEEMFNDQTFVPNPGFHCRSCQYSRFNSGPCKF